MPDECAWLEPERASQLEHRVLNREQCRLRIAGLVDELEDITMATPLCSLLGVQELITLSRQAIEAENNHPELLVPFYGFALLIFFAYCYPISRLTIGLERRFAVKL